MSFMKLAPLTICLALVGCSVVSNVGEDDAGGGRDAAPVSRGPYDECGNGMDDDGDGMIDEGCPCGLGEMQACFTGGYPFRGVGLCADGVQACDVDPGIEFGTWGACTGDRVPAEEFCDGTDSDCDGAVDEGCPCTAGQTQECGLEFVTEPCRGGTQSCTADGVWTSCEGAIGPSAEVCDDAVDNDCDGAVNEGCDCIPVPEVCGDAVDNDCDGMVDEPACGDASDAGVPMDAGSVDGGGLTDAGVPVLCTGGCVVETAWRNIGGSYTTASLGGEGGLGACAIPGGGAAVVAKDGEDIRYRHVNAAGTIVVERLLGVSVGSEWSDQRDIGPDLLCLSDRLILAYRAPRTWPTAESYVIAFDYTGVIVAGPTLVSPSAEYTSSPGLGEAAGVLHVTWFGFADGSGTSLYSRRFDTNLNPLGSPISLAPSIDINANFYDVMSRDSDVVVVFSNSAGSIGTTEHFLVTISGDSPGPVIPLGTRGRISQYRIAWAPGSMSFCWSEAVGSPAPVYVVRCQFLSEGGVPLGPVQTLTRSGEYNGPAFGLVAVGCGYRVVSYCMKSRETPCANGGEVLAGDPLSGAWTSEGVLPLLPNTWLPDRRPRTWTQSLGFIPLSASTIFDGNRLWHFGLANSSIGGGLTQLHDLRFECAG